VNRARWPAGGGRTDEVALGGASHALPTPPCTTCSSPRALVSITARRCISHVGQTPLCAPAMKSPIYTPVRVTYTHSRASAHPFGVSVHARLRARARACIWHASVCAPPERERERASICFDVHTNYLFRRGVALRRLPADHSTDFRHGRPYMNLRFVPIPVPQPPPPFFFRHFPFPSVFPSFSTARMRAVERAMDRTLPQTVSLLEISVSRAN
jgi:hypothetical protein